MRSQTYSVDDADALDKVGAFLSSHLTTHVRLEGAPGEDRVEVPPEVLRLLDQAVRAMRRGLSVTIAPHTSMLSTQQAAEMLNVSRPTVVKLIDQGILPHEMAGTHRRVPLSDVLAYREIRKAEQYAALDALYVIEQDEESIEDALAGLRLARKATRPRAAE